MKFPYYAGISLISLAFHHFHRITVNILVFRILIITFVEVVLMIVLQLVHEDS